MLRCSPYLPACFNAAIRSLIDSSVVAATIAAACCKALQLCLLLLGRLKGPACLLLHSLAGNLLQAGELDARRRTGGW